MPKKATKKATKKVAKVEKKSYKATAIIMGRSFEGVGETVYEAIGNLQTGGVAGRVILTVSDGETSKDRVIPMIAARKAFNTLGMTREVGLKNLSTLFSGL